MVEIVCMRKSLSSYLTEHDSLNIDVSINYKQNVY